MDYMIKGGVWGIFRIDGIVNLVLDDVVVLEM